MATLIVFALYYEAKPPIRALGLSRARLKSHARLYSEKNRDSTRVSLVILPPPGVDATGGELLAIMDRLRPRRVVHAGFSGALVPELRCGDLVYSSSEGSPAFARSSRLPGIREVRMTSSDKVVESVADRRALHVATGAHAVDMEGELVRRVCAQLGVPLVALRVISDSATELLPVPADVIWRCAAGKSGRGGGPNLLRLVSYLVLRPWRWKAFCLAVARWNHCRRKLATALLEMLGVLETNF